jgi:hypothetical protein
MAGLDPAIHENRLVDPRAKPGDDVFGLRGGGIADDVGVVEDDGEDGGATEI